MFLKGSLNATRQERTSQAKKELDDEKIKKEIDEFDEATWKSSIEAPKAEVHQDSCSPVSDYNFDPPDATDSDTQQSEHKDESCKDAAIKSELENTNVPDVL